MKKLFSSFISVVTSTLISAGSVIPVMSMAEYQSSEENYVESGYIFGDSNVSFLSNFKDGSYNYGEFLDANNSAVYTEMVKLLTPSIDTVTIKLPEPITISLSTGSFSSMTDADKEIYEDALMSACRSGIDSALFDLPELFWLDLAETSVGSINSSKRNWRTGKYDVTLTSISFTPMYYENFGSMESVMEYKEKLSDAVENFPVEGETRYEQLKSIHDYICKFTYYDVNSPFYSSPIGSLVEPGSVCEGYAEAFKLMCDKLNIPCVEIIGNFNEDNTEAHMWNYVQMDDGKWYGVDVTWDDTDNLYGQELKYTYFLKGSKTLSVNHTPADVYFYTNMIYPELSADDYDPSSSVVSTTTSATTSKTTTTTTTSKTTKSTTSTSKTTKTQTTTSTASSTTTKKTTTSTQTEVIPTTTVTEPITPPLPADVKGDVNKDGELNIADLVYCSRAVLCKVELTASCDVDEDGRIDSFDVALLRRLIIKLTVKK